MIRGLFWAALAAAGTMACGTPDRVKLPTTLAVSPDFSAEQTDAIFAAADAWSAATHGVVTLKTEIGSPGNAIRVAPTDSHYTEMGDTHVVDDLNADTFIDLSVVADQAEHVDHVSMSLELQDTAMHEFGHAFGLDHIDGGLMDPKKYNDCAVDADTLRRFCANYSCN